MLRAVKRSVMRIVVLPAGRCRFLEENESGLRFRRDKIWRFTECTTAYNRPSFTGIIVQNNVLSQFLSPPRCIDRLWHVVVATWQNDEKYLRMTNIPSRGEGRVSNIPCHFIIEGTSGRSADHSNTLMSSYFPLYFHY